MTVAVRGRVPRKWNDQTVRHITERLQALERSLSGGQDTFTNPGLPPSGPGTPGAPGAPGPPGAPGASDHGALTGLEDKEDHRQYVLHEEQAKPQPHIHTAADVVGVEVLHPLRGEEMGPHQHTLTDIPDHNLWENILWQRVHDPLYGG